MNPPRRSQATAGHLSPCAGISGASSNLTTLEVVRPGPSASDNTEVGPGRPPLLMRPPFLLGTSPSISQSPVPGPPALAALQMQTPRPLGEPGLGLGICIFNKHRGECQAWVKFKQQRTRLRAQVLDPPGFESQLPHLLLMSGELPHFSGPHHPLLKFPLSLTFLPLLFSPALLPI